MVRADLSRASTTRTDSPTLLEGGYGATAVIVIEDV